MQTKLSSTAPLPMQPMPKRAALFQLRSVLGLLALLVGALVCWGLQRSLQLPLPDMAWVAKYVGKGQPNFAQAQLLHNPWGVLPGCIWLAGRSHYLPTDAASVVLHSVWNLIGC